MAIAPQQQPPVGGLGAMAPAKPAPQQQQPAQQPNPAQAAQRISGLEQEAPEEDFMQKALRNKRAQEAALNAQIEALKNSLDSRMNPPFDTSLMAAASGFLKPTRTGGFGESLGYAAEAYATDADKVLARKQAADKAKLELAQKQAEIQNQRLMFEHQMYMQGYDPKEITTLGAGPTPAGGAPTGGAPAGGVPAGGAAPAGAPAGGAPAERRERPVTPDSIRVAGLISPEYGKQEMERGKYQRERFISTPQGMYDRDNNIYLKADPYLDQPIEAPLPFVGTQKITQRMLREIEGLSEKFPIGHPDRADQFARYYAGRGIGGVDYTPGEKPTTGGSAPGAAPGAAPTSGQGKPAVISGMETPGQKKLREEAESKTQELEIKRNDEQKGRIYSAGESAFGQALNADQMYKLATNSETKGAFGVLQKPTVRAAVLGAIREGVSTPKGPINFPGIEDAVRKVGGTDTEINAALQAARYASEMELTYARMFLTGQGAVSNNERVIVRNLGPSISDTPLVAAAKAEAIKARAEYDRQVADLFYEWEKNNPGKMVKDFQRDPEFKAIQKDYNDHLGKLNDKYFPGTKTEKPAASAPPAAPSTPAAPASKPPANETPLQKFEREKREREAAKGRQ